MVRLLSPITRPATSLVAALLFVSAACAPRQATSDVASPSAAAEPLRTTAVAPYVPPRGDAWATMRPAEAGMDSTKLAAAIAFAQASEIGWLTDMAAQVRQNTAREPYPEVLGETLDRGGQNGVILRHGYIVAEWGDTRKVDMTFSVAKSYLSTVAGIAYDRGLLRLDEPVGTTVRDGGFDSPHNAPITWRMLLNQTSEWEGELWGKPDRADRRRGYDRTLETPGTFWEYNDTRVNRTALALLRRFERPLPDVLRETIMEPIGASDSWRWLGYRTSFLDLNGQQVQSVSGGSHWGGGFWATTRDHARFGLLMARRGRWGNQQLVSEAWLREAWTPTPIRPVYGLLWWLNTGDAQYTGASESSVFALGAGGNVIWIDPEHDMVAVIRWTDTRKIDEFMRLVTESIVR